MSKAPSSVAPNIRDYLEKILLEHKYPPAGETETEPQYTARVIYPLIKNAIAQKAPAKTVWIRGDGANLQAYALSLLGFSFHPDIAVGEDQKRYWSLEVKLIKDSANGDILSKAIGQATLYSESYATTSVLLVVARKLSKTMALGTTPLANFNILTVSTD